MKKKRDRLEYMKKYREKNRDRILSNQKEYYRTHKTEIQVYQKAYRERMNAEMTDKEREEKREYHRVMCRIYRQIRRESRNENGHQDSKGRERAVL